MSTAKFARDFVPRYGLDAVRMKLRAGMTTEQVVAECARRRQVWIVYAGQRYTRAEFFKTYCPAYSVEHLYKQLERVATNGETLSQVLSKYTILSTQDLDTVSLITE